MGDVIFVAVILAFFGLMMLIVRWLHPMVLAASADEADEHQELGDVGDLELDEAARADGRG